MVHFDPKCSTERRHDVLVIKDGGGAVIAVRSGRDTADWAQDIRVLGDELTWTFKSDGSVNGWGFKFTVQPLMPKKSSGSMLVSDRVLQSRPSIDLVTCLLDFQLGRSPSRDSVSRLGAALASCAQINSLDAVQRTWAVQHLRKLINSGLSNILVSGAMGTCCPLKQVRLRCPCLINFDNLYSLFFIALTHLFTLSLSLSLSFSLSLSPSPLPPSAVWWNNVLPVLTGSLTPRQSPQTVQL